MAGRAPRMLCPRSPTIGMVSRAVAPPRVRIGPSSVCGSRRSASRPPSHEPAAIPARIMPMMPVKLSSVTPDVGRQQPPREDLEGQHGAGGGEDQRGRGKGRHGRQYGGTGRFPRMRGRRRSPRRGPYSTVKVSVPPWPSSSTGQRYSGVSGVRSWSKVRRVERASTTVPPRPYTRRGASSAARSRTTAGYRVRLGQQQVGVQPPGQRRGGQPVGEGPAGGDQQRPAVGGPGRQRRRGRVPVGAGAPGGRPDAGAQGRQRGVRHHAGPAGDGDRRRRRGRPGWCRWCRGRRHAASSSTGTSSRRRAGRGPEGVGEALAVGDQRGVHRGVAPARPGEPRRRVVPVRARRCARPDPRRPAARVPRRRRPRPGRPPAPAGRGPAGAARWPWPAAARPGRSAAAGAPSCAASGPAASASGKAAPDATYTVSSPRREEPCGGGRGGGVPVGALHPGRGTAHVDEVAEQHVVAGGQRELEHLFVAAPCQQRRGGLQAGTGRSAAGRRRRRRAWRCRARPRGSR